MKSSVTYLLGAVFALFTQVAVAQNPVIDIETNQGTIRVELFADKAPNTVNNFINYVNKDFYNGTIFHRVIDGFMIQGGGFTEDLTKKATDAPIQNEADNGVKNAVGTIAMARTQDPHSATAQFFINVADNDFLNHTAKDVRGWGYAVFGKVTEGMDVVHQIAKQKTGMRNGMGDVPNDTILIKQITVAKPEAQ